MNESFEHPLERFVRPDLESEIGELERVADQFGLEPSVLLFLAQEGELVVLDEATWQVLDNTDSNSLAAGDWERVQQLSQEAHCDWQKIQRGINSAQPLPAPTVMEIGGKYHLVAGNTRLMVARAAGIQPTIWLFHVEPPEKNPFNQT